MFRICVILGSGGLMLMWSILLYVLLIADPVVDPPADTGTPSPCRRRGVNNGID